nr:tRNA (adenosine(37)-N6)-threonylcarbamoyltransferase complex ATPase subunit type 1 TsaE [Brevibacterium marinum]
MRTFAEVLAGYLRAGDLLILSGNLGAGKTTFTQSLGKALGVLGRITSPTFVIAREHPSSTEGPTLVHVDAYRLSDADELGDLDLDSELDESITVVEWGAGLAEQLSSDYLGLTITPCFDVGDADGEEVVDDEVDDERRTVELHAHGSTWQDRLQQVGAAMRTVAAAQPEEEEDSP